MTDLRTAPFPTFLATLGMTKIYGVPNPPAAAVTLFRARVAEGGSEESPVAGKRRQFL